jgi:hypothetical protein
MNSRPCEFDLGRTGVEGRTQSGRCSVHKGTAGRPMEATRPDVVSSLPVNAPLSGAASRA